MDWKMISMKNVFESLPVAALLTCLMIAIAPQLASAQSGSAGGSIGNDDKSVSGARSAPRSVDQPERQARPSSDDPDSPRRPSRKTGVSGGGGGSFDGAWAVVIIGGPMCQGSVNGAFVVSSGRLIGDGTSGTVSPNGAAYATGTTKEGLTFTSSGRFSGRSGSGPFRRSDGCTGRWVATKQ
jgi:hypothetical protein